MTTFRTNDTVLTPNGVGVVQGWMHQDGQHRVLVRHTIAKMTGTTAGVCETPKAVLSGLWRYEASEITYRELSK